MTQRPDPVLRTTEAVHLTGRMAVYGSQAEAARLIPEQWRAFLAHPGVGGVKTCYGASPCTNDGKIHYLTGFAQPEPALEAPIDGGRLTLAQGEYAFVRVDDPTQLRDVWVWLLTTWLPASARRERHAPEFERYTAISATGTPVGPVEIWVPLEPLATT